MVATQALAKGALRHSACIFDLLPPRSRFQLQHNSDLKLCQDLQRTKLIIILTIFSNCRLKSQNLWGSTELKKVVYSIFKKIKIISTKYWCNLEPICELDILILKHPRRVDVWWSVWLIWKDLTTNYHYFLRCNCLML